MGFFDYALSFLTNKKGWIYASDEEGRILCSAFIVEGRDFKIVDGVFKLLRNVMTFPEVVEKNPAWVTFHRTMNSEGYRQEAKVESGFVPGGSLYFGKGWTIDLNGAIDPEKQLVDECLAAQLGA